MGANCTKATSTIDQGALSTSAYTVPFMDITNKLQQMHVDISGNPINPMYDGPSSNIKYPNSTAKTYDASGNISLIANNIVSHRSNINGVCYLSASGEVFTSIPAMAKINGVDTNVSSSLTSDVKCIYSSGVAFAALKNDNTVVSWGYNQDGGGPAGFVFTEGIVQTTGGGYININVELSNISTLCSTMDAFAALKNDGTVVTWGNSASGGDSSNKDLTGTVAIYSTDAAFAALKNDGTVVTWGDSSAGGNSSNKDLTNVKIIYSNDVAFAALKNDGTVVTWGNNDNGGNSSNKDLTNVKIIYHTVSAFAALKNNGTVVTWGNNALGGDSSNKDLTNVNTIYSSLGAFVALKNDGTIVSWGNTIYGGVYTGSSVSNIISVFAGPSAFAALNNNGTVTSWGDFNYRDSNNNKIFDTSGITINNIQYITPLLGFESLNTAGANDDQYGYYSTTFKALTKSGTIVRWGANNTQDTNNFTNDSNYLLLTNDTILMPNEPFSLSDIYYPSGALKYRPTINSTPKIKYSNADKAILANLTEGLVVNITPTEFNFQGPYSIDLSNGSPFGDVLLFAFAAYSLTIDANTGAITGTVNKITGIEVQNNTPIEISYKLNGVYNGTILDTFILGYSSDPVPVSTFIDSIVGGITPQNRQAIKNYIIQNRNNIDPGAVDGSKLQGLLTSGTITDKKVFVEPAVSGGTVFLNPSLYSSTKKFTNKAVAVYLMAAPGSNITLQFGSNSYTVTITSTGITYNGNSYNVGETIVFGNYRFKLSGVGSVVMDYEEGLNFRLPIELDSSGHIATLNAQGELVTYNAIDFAVEYDASGALSVSQLRNTIRYKENASDASKVDVTISGEVIHSLLETGLRSSSLRSFWDDALTGPAAIPLSSISGEGAKYFQDSANVAVNGSINGTMMANYLRRHVYNFIIGQVGPAGVSSGIGAAAELGVIDVNYGESDTTQIATKLVDKLVASDETGAFIRQSIYEQMLNLDVNRFVGATGDHATGVSGEGIDSEYRQLPFAVNDSLSFLITFKFGNMALGQSNNPFTGPNYPVNAPIDYVNPSGKITVIDSDADLSTVGLSNLTAIFRLKFTQ
jgi:alpha-tubulin suppressor-like RCC1 family protein